MSEVSITAIKRSFGRGEQGAAKKRKTDTKKTKKKKKPSIKAFFQTVTNSQGFPIHKCRYEERIGDHVYVPPNYDGRLSLGGAIRGKTEFCPWCKLKPCIAVEHFEDIFHKSYNEHSKAEKRFKEGRLNQKNNEALINRIARSTNQFMRKYFGSEYTKKVGTPHCIMNDIFEYNYNWIKEKREEMREEEEQRREQEEESDSDGDTVEELDTEEESDVDGDVVEEFASRVDTKEESDSKEEEEDDDVPLISLRRTIEGYNDDDEEEAEFQ